MVKIFKLKVCRHSILGIYMRENSGVKKGEGGICSKGAYFWYIRKYGGHETFILQALRSMEVWQLSIVAKTDTNSTMIAM